MCAFSKDCFTAFEYASLIHALSGLSGIYSLFSHTEKSLLTYISYLVYTIFDFVQGTYYIQNGKFLLFERTYSVVVVLAVFRLEISSSISLSSFICFLYLRSPYNLQENTCNIETISCRYFYTSSDIFVINIYTIRFYCNCISFFFECLDN